MRCPPSADVLRAECDSQATPSAIRAQLDRIVGSPEFRNSPRLKRFLTFVVEMTLEGKAERIKAYTIAIEALGRGPEFDPQIDPIIRVQAGRLRQALGRYYANAGRNYPVVIEMPRGAYVPSFRGGGVEQPDRQPPHTDDRLRRRTARHMIRRLTFGSPTKRPPAFCRRTRRHCRQLSGTIAELAGWRAAGALAITGCHASAIAFLLPPPRWCCWLSYLPSADRGRAQPPLVRWPLRGRHRRRSRPHRERAPPKPFRRPTIVSRPRRRTTPPAASPSPSSAAG